MANVPFIIEAKTKGLGAANSKIGKLSGSMKGLTIAATATAVAFGVKGLAGTLFKIAKASVNTAAEFEMMKVQLNVLYGSVQRGTQAFNKFNDIAAKTPFALQDVVQAGVALKSFGIDAEEVLPSVADLAARMDISMSEAASNVGRAFSAGAGAADQFREKGINPLIAAFAGVDHVSELTLPQFREAMFATFTDPASGIAGMTIKMSETWTGMVSNFKDGVDRLKAAIGDELLKVLKPQLDKVNTEFSKLGEIGFENIAKAISEDLETATELARVTARAMGKILGVVIVTGIKEGLNLMFPTIGDLIFTQIRMYLDGIEKLFGELEFVNVLREKLDSLIETNEALSTSFVDLGTDMSTEILAIMATLDTESEALLEKILTRAKKIKEETKDEEGGDEDPAAQTEKEVSWLDKKMEKVKELNATELAAAAKSASSASEGFKKSVSGFTMEIVAAAIASAFKNVPFPLNLIAAATAGGLAKGIIDGALAQIPEFATGGSFVTGGDQLIRVGDNPSGREAVNITPLDAAGEPTSVAGGVNITFTGNVMSQDFIENEAIPQIRDALRRGASLGVS